MNHSPLLKASLATVGALALLGSSFTGTAVATGSHGARSDRTTITEDNDHNDGGTPNNVVDDGDNRHPSGKDRSVENGGSGSQGASSSDPDGTSNGGADKPGGAGGYDKADQDGNNGCGNDDDFEDDNNGNCGGKAHEAEVKATEVKATEVKAAGAEDHTSCDRRIEERDQRLAAAEARRVETHDDAVTADKQDASGGEVLAASAITSTPSPAVSAASANGADAPAGEVLSNSAVAAPASAEVMATQAAAPAPAEVTLAAVSTRSSGGVLGAVSGALAFTGLNAVTLLLVALSAIAIGWALLRTSRKRTA
ncbi:MAG: hypothetical protein JWN29_1759 [Acidimicrobiales bacterium]|nr:hypothetical protein [Acidimicrobiales bacterium]